MAFKEKTLEMLSGMRKYPQMFIPGEQTYEGYCRYFLGYLAAADIFSGIDWEGRISQWYQVHYGHPGSNLVFFDQLERNNRHLSEEEKIELLLDVLELFFGGL